MFSKHSKVAFGLLKNSFCTKTRSCQEVRIPVPWGHVAGKWWGPTDRRPVLCLHGWQDNCGTFDRLMPLLSQEAGFLAVDFPGHGYSSHLPPGMYYHHSIYPLVVNYVANYFKWNRLYLMGHSLGGITAFTYSMFLPQSVDFLICLDASKPLAVVARPAIIAQEFKKFMKYERMQRSQEEPPSYTMDEIKERIAAAQNKSIDIRYSHYIAERNIRPSKKYPNKFYFARDPRLKVEPFLNWEQKQLVENAKDMTFPMLIMKALSSSYFEPKEKFYEVMDVIGKNNKNFYLCKLEGTHHLHLNNPEELSKVINDFLEKYHKVDKTKGGIQEEIIVTEKGERAEAVCQNR